MSQGQTACALLDRRIDNLSFVPVVGALHKKHEQKNLPLPAAGEIYAHAGRCITRITLESGDHRSKG
jgi:hypothetical protein